ncbi:MAG: ribonuclease P protein component [Candidatus Kapaibacterium sp.]
MKSSLSQVAKPVLLDRSRTLRGLRDIEWFLQTKRPIRSLSGIKMQISGAWSKRPIGDLEPIQFLLLVSKRSVKEANDRNQLRRWMREAVRNTSEFYEIELLAKKSESQVIIMLRASNPPSKNIQFHSISNEIRDLAQNLVLKLSSIETQPLVLRTKSKASNTVQKDSKSTN